MSKSFCPPRLAALMCVAIALLVALSQPVLGLIFLFLVPFWFFLGLVVSFTVPIVRNIPKAVAAPSVFQFSPRPPPAK